MRTRRSKRARTRERVEDQHTCSKSWSAIGYPLAASSPLMARVIGCSVTSHLASFARYCGSRISFSVVGDVTSRYLRRTAREQVEGRPAGATVRGAHIRWG